MTDVVKLVTRPERQAIEEEAFRDSTHAEAIGMLERALEAVRGRMLADGARCTGLAISFAFENGSYGRFVPEGDHSTGLLIGSVGTTHHDLILRTLVIPGAP